MLQNTSSCKCPLAHSQTLQIYKRKQQKNNTKNVENKLFFWFSSSLGVQNKIFKMKNTNNNNKQIERAAAKTIRNPRRFGAELFGFDVALLFLSFSIEALNSQFAVYMICLTTEYTMQSDIRAYV